ncbi:hypothetical protein NDU88_000405 [Pleurodeles waltl]|uniref:Zinc finger CCHC domain-containing protein n=1 Tax=Pleurodeles waltl TaxID=8319 RepID=A0AAV7KPW3_PLEWA|nr:hypothetical protein NDU88_000405 [Pleurodeles waltl]
MTVHVYNLHVNIQDLSTFLRRHCTVTKEPCRNLDSDGIWDSKWTVMMKLKEDPGAPDGIHHPPSSFSLGRDSGYLPLLPREAQTVQPVQDYPQRAKSYAQAGKPPGRATQEEAAVASLPVPAPKKTKETGRRKGPRQEQAQPDQGSTQALEP